MRITKDTFDRNLCVICKDMINKQLSVILVRLYRCRGFNNIWHGLQIRASGAPEPVEGVEGLPGFEQSCCI
jgi:hypothetical protein